MIRTAEYNIALGLSAFLSELTLDHEVPLHKKTCLLNHSETAQHDNVDLHTRARGVVVWVCVPILSCRAVSERSRKHVLGRSKILMCTTARAL